MKNLIYILLCGLLGLVLFSFMIQQTTHWLDFEKLKGVEVPKPMPELTFKSYADGSFQSGTEEYLKQNFGFREPILRNYNQYLWDCYKKTYVPRGILVQGKDGWLYEPWAVNDYYQVQYLLHAGNAEVRYMEHLGGINMQNLVIGPRTLKDSIPTKRSKLARQKQSNYGIQ